MASSFDVLSLIPGGVSPRVVTSRSGGDAVIFVAFANGRRADCRALPIRMIHETDFRELVSII